jgi:hypothetical protein
MVQDLVNIITMKTLIMNKYRNKNINKNKLNNKKNPSINYKKLPTLAYIEDYYNYVLDWYGVIQI